MPWHHEVKATEEDWLTGEIVKAESPSKLTDPFFRRCNHSVGLTSCQNLKSWYHATVPEPPLTYLHLLHVLGEKRGFLSGSTVQGVGQGSASSLQADLETLLTTDVKRCFINCLGKI